MMKDGHWIADPLDVITAKPDFSGLGLTDEERRIFKAIDKRVREQEHEQLEKEIEKCKAISRKLNLEIALGIIKQAIALFGENRSLGNVAANIEAIIKNMEK